MVPDETLSRIRSSPGPLVLDVWAPWCLPCRAIEPRLERLAARYAGRVELLRVNADEQPQAAGAFGVLAIPTLIAFHGGRELTRRTGALPQSDLEEVFRAALEGAAPSHAGPRPIDRWLRMLAGGALFLIGMGSGPTWVLLAAGGLVLFSAVYDRCPVWQALGPRLAAWARRATR